ncbi:hypothetical protein PSW56_23585, partial [Shigella flexneri]|nr:hypothetical protein [Shigella flexneri]
MNQESKLITRVIAFGYEITFVINLLSWVIFFLLPVTFLMVSKKKMTQESKLITRVIAFGYEITL